MYSVNSITDANIGHLDVNIEIIVAWRVTAVILAHCAPVSNGRLVIMLSSMFFRTGMSYSNETSGSFVIYFAFEDRINLNS